MNEEDKLIINQNFKVTAVTSKAIEDNARELGMSNSEFLRLCVYIGGPLLLSCPALANTDRMELTKLATTIGATLVIHPATISFIEKELSDNR